MAPLKANTRSTGSDSPCRSIRVRHAFSRFPLHRDRKSTRLNSSHTVISYAVFCLKNKIDTPHEAAAGLVLSINALADLQPRDLLVGQPLVLMFRFEPGRQHVDVAQEHDLDRQLVR